MKADQPKYDPRPSARSGNNACWPDNAGAMGDTAKAIAVYARKIKLAKRLVPAAFFGLLVLIFTWPYLRDYESGFTLSFEDLSHTSGTLRMENPHYVGIDSGRRRFEIDARSALQSQSEAGEINLDQIRASVRLQDNSDVVLTAPKGTYLPHQSQLSLTGGISILSGDGYKITLDHADYNVQTAIASSNHRVTGNAPFGTFVANSFRANIDGRTFKLDGAVHVRIEPRKFKQDNIPGNGGQTVKKGE